MTACSKSAFWQTLPRVYGQAALTAATYEVFAAEPHPKNELLGLATPLKFLSTGLCGGNDLNCSLHGDNARKLAAEPLFATRQHC